MYKKYLPILLILIVGFFLWEMIFKGLIIPTGDNGQHEPIKKWVQSTDDISHWFPNLFSGMPSYGGYIQTPGNPLKPILNFFWGDNLGIRLWFYLSLGGIGLYFFTSSLKYGIFPSFFGGISYALSPHIFGLINAGHHNKIIAMSYIPWIMLAVFKLFKNRTIKSILFLSLISSLQLWSNHPQIVYYTWIIIMLWFLIDLILSIKENQFRIKRVYTNLSLLIASLIISMLMVSDPYFDVYNFQKHSNRGSESVSDVGGDTKTGTKYDYATQWSFHPSEVISFVYPYFYGLQNFNVNNTSSPERFLKQVAYWGYMPFTQSTHYLGLLIIIFSIFGLISKKQNKIEIVFWISSLIIILIGFGKHFSILYDILFYVAPFFSKFRIPSMIYISLIFTFSVLSVSGLSLLFHMGKEHNDLYNKNINYIFITLGLVTLFLFIFGESIFSFYTEGDLRFKTSNYLSIIQTIRIKLFNKGLVLALFIILSSYIIISYFIKNKISNLFFISSVIFIQLIDFYIVDNEFLNLKPAKNMSKQFIHTPITKYLQNQEGFFRIFPTDDFNSNKYGYWGIQSIGGYRAVKLRNYQDLMDAGGFSNSGILDMLNVKYILTNKNIKNPNFTKVEKYNGIFENLNVLPKAWFIGKIKNVTSQKESLNSLISNTPDLSEAAIVVNYNGEIIYNPVNDNVEIKSLESNEIFVKTSNDSSSLLVLSEIYYKPNWECYIDNQKVDIFQTNHVLRSVYVPSGKHNIKFIYNKNNWEKARLLSRSLFYLSLIVVLFLCFYKRFIKINNIE